MRILVVMALTALFACHAAAIEAGRYSCTRETAARIDDDGAIVRDQVAMPKFIATLKIQSDRMEVAANYGRRTHMSRFAAAQETGVLFVMRDDDGAAEYFSTLFFKNDGTYVSHFPGYGVLTIVGKCARIDEP